ncbi:Phosphoenolpyruvate/pyruvate domain-containing protein [Thozetella sp. PMI_491]|nr:Phosphoenolpyruvate/pyruvate domain-containing protein [Thozetella sp. PMI_491]
MRAYAAPSLFQPHHTRQAIRDAHERKVPPMLGVYYGVSSVPTCRLLAPIGFDMIWIDWEHSACNVETMTTMVHDTMFMSQGRTIPWVRIPGHDHAAIGYVLDCGANIVVPQVNTVEQCKYVLSATKYGSQCNGTRSAPPFRLLHRVTDIPSIEGGDLHKCLNEQAAVMIQIETLEGINNLDAILTECPDIDCVWLGSLDARINMNLPGGLGHGNEPAWLDAVTIFEQTLAKHNKPRGGFALGLEALKKCAETHAVIFYDADVLRLGGMMEGLCNARDIVEKTVEEQAP